MDPDSVFCDVPMESITKSLRILDLDTYDDETLKDRCQRMINVIPGCKDICHILDVMEALDVQTAGSYSISEMKERLILHLESLTRGSDDLKNKFDEIKSNFEKQKKELCELYERFNKILQNSTPEMREHLTHEDTLSDVSCDVSDKLQTLKDSDCTIVVTGETGAGKSTLLNLFLGDTVLPHHALSCTSTICKIKYGPQKRVRITSCTMEVDDFDITESAETKTKLKEALFKRSGREQGPDIKQVEIFIPSDLLRGGLVLIDTPGIGENEAMEDMLTKFISENHIQGFIYVVKIDGGDGGVQEDRILKLLNMVLEKQQSGNSDATDTCLHETSAALFVCNRWDLVPDDEQPKVKENAEKKLRHCWPVKDSEIVFMSAMSALRQLQSGFQSEKYTLLLKAIIAIMNKAMFLIMKRFFRWLNYMVSRSLHRTKTLFSAADYSEFEQKTRFDIASRKMDILQQRSERIFQDIAMKIRENEVSLKMKLNAYLNSKEAKAIISTFTPEEIQRVKESKEKDDDMSKILENKIVDLLLEWKDMQEEFSSMQTALIQLIKKKMYVLQEELDDIEATMEESGRYTFISEESTCNDLVSFSSSRRPSNVSVNSWRLPVQPTNIPFSAIGRFFKFAIRALKQGSLKKSFEDTQKYMQRTAQSFIDDFIKDNEHEDFVERQLEPVRHYLNTVKENIPKLIRTNKKLILEIKQNHEAHRMEKENYAKALANIIAVKDEIAHFGYSHTFSHVIKKENVKMSERSPSSSGDQSKSVIDSGIFIERTKRPHQGLFYKLVHGHYNAEVTIRKYFPNVKIENVYTEVEKLEQLHHESVIKFLGIMSTNTPKLPSVVTEQRLVPIRSRLNILSRRASVPHTNKYSLPVILHDIVSGLVYIHSKGLVHPEVSLDSVTINFESKVKLCGAAQPRKVFIGDRGLAIGDFVYLPPEVLKEGLYTAAADMYGLGLLICELFTQNKVFNKQREGSIDDFLTHVRPDSICKSEYFELVPERYRAHVQQCLELEPSRRLTSKVMWKGLTKET